MASSPAQPEQNSHRTNCTDPTNNALSIIRGRMANPKKREHSTTLAGSDVRLVNLSDANVQQSSSAKPSSSPDEEQERARKRQAKCASERFNFPPSRESCKYGIDCNRNNPVHFFRFSHPFDFVVTRVSSWDDSKVQKIFELISKCKHCSSLQVERLRDSVRKANPCSDPLGTATFSSSSRFVSRHNNEPVEMSETAFEEACSEALLID